LKSVDVVLSNKLKNGGGLKRKKYVQLYGLCAIPLLLVFVFNYIPMFGIFIAFKEYRYDLGILRSKWVGLNNFKVFMMSDDFMRITVNTIVMNFIFIIVGMVCAIILAILLFETRNRKGVKIYQTMMITPNFLSWVVAGYMVYAFLNPDYGFINKLIGLSGHEKIDWYSKPVYWPAILTICSVWKSIGMDSVIYYAALMGIDTELFEAARIDGANKRQEVLHITIPQLLPLITILGILKIGGIFRADFGLFYQTTRNVSALYSVADVMDTYIFRTMRVLGDMSISSAAGVLQSVVGFLCVVITNYIVKKIDPDRALF